MHHIRTVPEIPFTVAHPATDFLQRIVEDILVGDVIRPFKVHAPRIGVPVHCIVILGDLLGTNMFCLEEYTQDDDEMIQTILRIMAISLILMPTTIPISRTWRSLMTKTKTKTTTVRHEDLV
jgi:hypothetical protein